jgi:hypothetical protein
VKKMESGFKKLTTAAMFAGALATAAFAQGGKTPETLESGVKFAGTTVREDFAGKREIGGIAGKTVREDFAGKREEMEI